jgi:chromosome partitioning protein
MLKFLYAFDITGSGLIILFYLSDFMGNKMRRVIFNQKGGVGKSTITCNLAAISAMEGKRTLVIDLDVQGNSTQYLLGNKVSDSDKTIALFFKDCLSISLFGGNNGSGLESVIHETPFPNLFVIPSHPELEPLQGRLESRFKIFKLREALDKLEGFDAVYMDTPPVLNFYSQSALIAAEKCLIPFDCDTFAREALYTLMQSVTEVKADHNQALEIEGIIVNQFQKQANLPRQLVDELIAEGLPVLAAMISPSVKVRESHSASQPLIHYVPNHKLSDEYRALYAEIHND